MDAASTAIAASRDQPERPGTSGTTGDFNGDGHADILWQNDNGSVATG
jgi:hypothetical protein